MGKAILTLIEIYSNQGNAGKVEEKLAKLQGTPEYNRAMTMIGDLYVSKQQYQKALEMYAKSNQQMILDYCMGKPILCIN